MIKRPPSITQTLLLAGFVISAFGLLLWLWLSFGGEVPLRPQSYRIQVRFDEGTQLADQAQVRISGVPVGNVVGIELGEDRKLADVELEIDADHAPLPADTRAVLREKTLLGETYVELSPGDDDGPHIPEGGTLPEGQVSSTVQLDEILRVFDPETRQAFQTWMIDSAAATKGRGRGLNSAFAQLEDFFSGFEEVFRTLDSQENAVQRLFADGTKTFDALSRTEGALSGTIESAERVFSTTAARDREIVDAFRAFPAFLEESRLTLKRLGEFSEEADPLAVQLVPVARELSPTFNQLAELAPPLDRFLNGVEPVIDRSDETFTAFRKFFRKRFPPFLRDFDRRFLRDLNPILEVIDDYSGELTALLGNAAGALNAQGEILVGGQESNSRSIKYLRTLPSIGPESVTAFTERRPTFSRANAYLAPRDPARNQPGYLGVRSGLPGFETRQCDSGVTATLDPATALDPDFLARVDGETEEEREAAAQDFFNRIQEFAFGGQTSTADTSAPPCRQQGPFGPFDGTPGPGGGQPTAYPHTITQP